MINEKNLFWLTLFAIFCYILYSVSEILFPFITAMVIAYFLNPLVNRLENHYRVPRVLSAAIVITLFFLLIVIISIKLLPIISEQIGLFIKDIPKYKQYVHDHVIIVIANTLGKIDQTILQKVQSTIQDLSTMLFKYLAAIISNIWTSGMALVNIISLIFITPIVTFYMLRDWKTIVKAAESWIPLASKSAIQQQLKLIDKVLSGFIRGQTNVCIFLAVFYSIGLSLVGLNFALFVGIATGILAFIPYLGILFGALTGIIIALLQFNNIKDVLLVIAVFITGQFIEGNFITPKIVGEKIGLHPIWLFFILLAGGSLFGFVGVLFAVPIGAVIGVIIRALIQIYLSSSYYSK